MKRTFKLCSVSGYIYGDTKRPDPVHNPTGAENWDFNDTYTARIIFSNISASQKIHVGQDCPAHEMWDNLEAIYEVTGHTTIINYVRTLFKCNVEDGDNILEHLSNLRLTFERIHTLSAQEFKISDLFFKVIISSSLPPSWDNFTQAYIAETRHHATHEPFRNMFLTEFIGVIKSEAERQLRRPTPAQNTHSTFGSGTRRRRKGKGRASSPSLLKRITQEVTQKVQGMKLGDTENHVDDDKLFCKRCMKPGHKTDDCYLWNRKKCIHCDKFNHASEDCYFKDKPKLEKKGKAKENSHKRSRTKEANTADSDHSYAVTAKTATH